VVERVVVTVVMVPATAQVVPLLAVTVARVPATFQVLARVSVTGWLVVQLDARVAAVTAVVAHVVV
jgi:hypothetical protein